MPIYEYRCLGCREVFSFLVGVVANSGEPVCPKCGAEELEKLISRVALVRSQEAVFEDLADPSRLGDLEDPKAMARWAKKMGKALGEESGEEFGEELSDMLDEPEAAGGDLDEE